MSAIYKKCIIVLFCIFSSSILFISFSNANSNKIEEIIINGNNRISNETIIIFSEVQTNENVTNERLNQILKNLYNTNYFEDVKINVLDNRLIIEVVEAPIIDKVEFDGIKAQKIQDALRNLIKLKSRSSYNSFIVNSDKNLIKEYLKEIGYYFSKVETLIEELDDNLVTITHKIDLGNKAKIKKISFIGDKIYKDSKLKNIIVSEEYKFWKLISGKKYLNEQNVNLDIRLLKNFYLQKGYYNVEINSSFAKLIDDESFELIFNVNPKNKIFFNNLKLKYPNDFDPENFIEINNLFDEIKGEPYSIKIVEKILDKIDFITLNEEYKSINANVEEKLTENKLDLNFIIEKDDIYVVEQINIFGNNITRESVIRNNLEINEGDPFNKILQKKSENNLKSLNYFRSVSSEVIDTKQKNRKIININVEEKPTGEISAGAGAGTSGGTFLWGKRK